MLVEREVSKALTDYAAGKKVLVLREMNDGSFETINLQEILDGNHYLVDVPAIENPDFKQAVADMTSENSVTYVEHASEEDIPVLDDPLPVPVESTPSENFGGGKKQTKKAIVGALVGQGLTYKQISEQTGISYGTVSAYGSLFKAQQESVNTEPKDNTDGHLCKTCKYRGKGANGCDYILIEGHSRGCTADSCTVYVEGPRLASAKRALSL